jgi:hypothetical protein
MSMRHNTYSERHSNNGLTEREKREIESRAAAAAAAAAAVD